MNKTTWSLTENQNLYILTLDALEGVEKLWLTKKELEDLKLFLNSLEVGAKEDRGE